MQPQPLDENIIAAFMQQLEAAPTPRLMDTWEANDRTAHSAEEFEAIRRILLNRNVLLPPQRNAAPGQWSQLTSTAPVKKSKSVMIWVVVALVVLGLCGLCVGAGVLIFKYGDQLGLGDLLGQTEPTPQPTISVLAPTLPASKPTAQVVQPGSPTAQPQAGVPTATAVKPNSLPDPAYATWTVLMADDFSSNVNGWPEGEGEANDYMDNTWEFNDGKLEWRASAKDTNLYWMAWPTLEDLSDFYVSLDVQKALAPTSNDVGLFFRMTGDGNFYAYSVNDSTGEYAIYLVKQDDWTELVDWTSAPAIRIGKPNKLAVAAEGDNLRFYINDRLVENLTDSTFLAGSLGITISTYDVNDEATFTFDNLEVRVKP